MKRYHMEASVEFAGDEDEECVCEAKKHQQGEWVRYDDAHDMLLIAGRMADDETKHLKADIKRLRFALGHIDIISMNCDDESAICALQVCNKIAREVLDRQPHMSQADKFESDMTAIGVERCVNEDRDNGCPDCGEVYCDGSCTANQKTRRATYRQEDQ